MIAKHLNRLLELLRSIDLWLTFASVWVSSTVLQGIDSVPTQAMWLAAIAGTAIAISAITKWKRNWRRTSTGWKGTMFAVGILAFFSYALCDLSILQASKAGAKLSGTFISQALQALSNPSTFGLIAPLFLFPILSAASFLGFTDLPNSED